MHRPSLKTVVEYWIESHDEAAKIMKIWLNNGVRFGVFCSQAVWIASQFMQSSDFTPDDIDLMVMKEDFTLAKRLLPQPKLAPRRKLLHKSRDNFRQKSVVTEVVCQIGQDSLQFMYQHGPIYAYTIDGHSLYSWYFSQLAFDNCLIVETDQGAISVAHPFDTVAFYGILQRQHKDDLPKAASLIGLSHIWPAKTEVSYKQMRSQEIGADARVNRFMQDSMWRYVIDGLSAGEPLARV